MNFRIENDSILEEIRLKSITERTKVLNERKQSQPVLITVPSTSSGGNGGDNTVNNYVETGYVENYFE
jgi:hypothetical protein